MTTEELLLRWWQGRSRRGYIQFVAILCERRDSHTRKGVDSPIFQRLSSDYRISKRAFNESSGQFRNIVRKHPRIAVSSVSLTSPSCTAYAKVRHTLWLWRRMQLPATAESVGVRCILASDNVAPRSRETYSSDANLYFWPLHLCFSLSLGSGVYLPCKQRFDSEFCPRSKCSPPLRTA